MNSEAHSKPAVISGFDYSTGKAVAMTAAEWRRNYPPESAVRDTLAGDTLYYRRVAGPDSFRVYRAGLLAEAYAIIPAGRGK